MGETLEVTYEDLINTIEKRAKTMRKPGTYVEAKVELGEETYPMLASVVEFFGERFERMERAVAELIDQTESFIQPDLAEQLIGTLNMGRMLAEAVTKLRQGPLDAITLGKLKQSAAAFLTAANMTEEAVVSVTVEPPEDGEEGDEDGEGEEGDEEDTDGGEEPMEVDAEAPVEVELPDTPPENVEKKALPAEKTKPAEGGA